MQIIAQPSAYIYYIPKYYSGQYEMKQCVRLVLVYPAVIKRAVVLNWKGRRR